MTSVKLAALTVTTFLMAGFVPAAAKDWSHVKVGVEGAFPPWNMVGADGKLAGYDIDVIDDLCRRAKVTCDLTAQEWSGLIPALNAGKFDIVLNLGINEARRKVVDFTIPYASTAATFVSLKDGPVLPHTAEPLNLNDKAKADPVIAAIDGVLKGKTIGVIGSSSHEQFVETYLGKDVTVRTYTSSQARDLDLAAGRVDAGFDSVVYVMYVKDKPGNEGLAATGPLIKGAMLATEVAIGMRKGEPELKAIFDRAIGEAIADGTIRRLSVKWSKVDLTPALDSAAN